MCRNIKRLRNLESPASKDEIYAAALQYVRKVSGLRKPSKLNQAKFMRAVEQVAAVTEQLLASLSPGEINPSRDTTHT